MGWFNYVKDPRNLGNFTGAFDSKELTFVTDRIAVGSFRYNVKTLQRNGITHVVSAIKPLNDPEGTVHLKVYTEDDGKLKGLDYWLQSIEFAVEALDNPESRIYIHCRQGKNRGPAHTYAVLRVMGFSSRRAIKRIQKARRGTGSKFNMYLPEIEEALTAWSKRS